VTRDAVAVGVGWELVGEKKIADREELRDVLFVMGATPGAKYCGALMPPDAVSRSRNQLSTGVDEVMVNLRARPLGAGRPVFVEAREG